MRIGLCFAAIALSCAAGGGPARGQQPRPGSCIVHVWGAQRDFTNDTRLAGPFAVRGGWHGDRANGLANINILDPVRRAGDLDEAAIAALLPASTNVEIVRHPHFAEIARANGTRSPLHGPAAGCSADLIVMDLYDLDGAVDSRGLLTGLLRAPNGWHVTYIFRRFEAGRLVSAEKQSMVAPLRLARPDWPNDPSAALAAIDEAMDASLLIFRQRLERRRR
jgi:hypothetical protein